METKIFIEEISRSDLLTINNWRNDAELISFLSAPFRYINIETDEMWFDSYMSNRSSQVRCAIRSTKGGDILGIVSLTDIDQVSRTSQVHIQIGDQAKRGSGIGSAALLQIIRHGFYNLNLNRIYAYVLKSNERSIRLFQSAKFQTEGTLRQAVYKEGSYHDLLILSILEHEFIN